MVCDEYAASFEKMGIKCVLHSVCELKGIPHPAEFELVGFAYPVHGFNAPYVMYRFVRKLPEETGKNYFIVKTSGEPVAMNNASAIHLCDKLHAHGFGALTNEYHYVMPYNMIFRHTDLQAQKMWNTAKALVPMDVAEITFGKHNIPERPPFGRLVSWALRIEHPAMKLNGRCFKVTDKCVKCMQCVNNCPVKNIRYDTEKGKFVFGGDCIMCTRCSFNCPKNAIKIGVLNGWKVNGRYNFANPDTSQTCKKPNYCKKSYKRYFENAQKRIGEFESTENAMFREVAATTADHS